MPFHSCVHGVRVQGQMCAHASYPSQSSLFVLYAPPFVCFVPLAFMSTFMNPVLRY